MKSRKASRAYLQRFFIQRAEGLHDGVDEASISSPHCSCVKAFFLSKFHMQPGPLSILLQEMKGATTSFVPLSQQPFVTN